MTAEYLTVKYSKSMSGVSAVDVQTFLFSLK